MKSKPHYVLVGDGRMAHHMRHYLDLLELPNSGWARNSASSFNSVQHSDSAVRLQQTLRAGSIVLLLVSDAAIASVLKKYPFLHQNPLVHCAGALSLPGVAGAHPLMTFSGSLYSLERYQSIPFMIEEGYRFDDILPGLNNPHHSLSVEKKALYHALCVSAGNFPQLLWQAVGQRMETELQVPSGFLEPYLRQVLANFLNNPEQALTGPLARGDEATIGRNLSALDGDPLQGLYQAFNEFYRQTAKDSGALPLQQKVPE